MAPLDPKNDRPLYLQVADYIREGVYAQKWSVGECIPSEYELVKMLGISRGTIKKGISILVHEGLLCQRRGKGTYIVRPLIRRPTGQSLLSISEALKNEGVTFSTEVLDLYITQANASQAEHMKINEGNDVVILRRVRRDKDRIFILMESCLNPEICPGIDCFDYSHRSLFDAVENSSHKKISYSSARYGAHMATPRQVSELKLEKQEPLLHVDQIVYLEDGTPIEWANLWYPANYYVSFSLIRPA